MLSQNIRKRARFSVSMASGMAEDSKLQICSLPYLNLCPMYAKVRWLL